MKKLLTLLMLGIFFFSLTTISAKPLTCYDDVVSVWHFDETSGNSTIDSCGSNDGTIYNTYSWDTGQYDNGLTFNGEAGTSTATYVDVGNDSSLNFGNESFSVTVWFSRLELASTERGLVGKITEDWATGWLLEVEYVGGTSFLTLKVYDDPNDDVNLSII